MTPKKEEDLEKTHLRADDLYIKGPLGWSIRANGRQAGLWVILLLAFGSLLYMVREHDVRAAEQITTTAVTTKVQVAEVAAGQQRLHESMETVVYILSLNPEERARLKLDMPRSLRSKLLNQERPR